MDLLFLFCKAKMSGTFSEEACSNVGPTISCIATVLPTARPPSVSPPRCAQPSKRPWRAWPAPGGLPRKSPPNRDATMQCAPCARTRAEPGLALRGRLSSAPLFNPLGPHVRAAPRRASRGARASPTHATTAGRRTVQRVDLGTGGGRQVRSRSCMSAAAVSYSRHTAPPAGPAPHPAEPVKVELHRGRPNNVMDAQAGGGGGGRGGIRISVSISSDASCQPASQPACLASLFCVISA